MYSHFPKTNIALAAAHTLSDGAREHLFHKDVSEQLNCKQTGETVECCGEKQWRCQLEDLRNAGGLPEDRRLMIVYGAREKRVSVTCLKSVRVGYEFLNTHLNGLARSKPLSRSKFRELSGVSADKLLLSDTPMCAQRYHRPVALLHYSRVYCCVTVAGLRKTLSAISVLNLRSTIRNTMSPLAMLFETCLNGIITPSTLR